MFENLYCEKLKFDWNNMEVTIREGNSYIPLDLERFRKSEIEKGYINWMRTLDYLALEYKCCSGPKFTDCPVDDSEPVHNISIYNKNDLRIEINMFIFVGTYLGYIKWEWENKFFFKLGNITLFKKWFDKGYYLNKKIKQKKGA